MDKKVHAQTASYIFLTANMKLQNFNKFCFLLALGIPSASLFSLN